MAEAATEISSGARRLLRPAPLALLAVLLICFLPRLRKPLPDTYPADFRVYYAAASLIRHGEAADLYTGADTGADPQKALAAPSTPIFHAAADQGLTFVGLYVYPPILADMLVPLTFVPLSEATRLWYGINVGFLVLTAVTLCRLLGIRCRSPLGLLLLASVFCFVPTLQCLTDGQITIFLLLLWAFGTLLLQQERPGSAAAVFALAAGIKLTPGIVLLPFLLWRRWRFTASFLGFASLFTLAAFVLNTPHACTVYLTRVLPSMSGAVPYLTNYSLPAATEQVLTFLRTGKAMAYAKDLPRSTALVGKSVSGLMLICTLGLLARMRHGLTTRRQVMAVGLLSLLAPVLSPVSWFHAYSTAFVGLVLIWSVCLTENSDPVLLFGVTLISLLLGTAVSENVLQTLESSGHALAAILLQFSQLWLAGLLVLYQLWRTGSPQPMDSSRAAKPALPGIQANV